MMAAQYDDVLALISVVEEERARQQNESLGAALKSYGLVLMRLYRGIAQETVHQVDANGFTFSV